MPEVDSSAVPAAVAPLRPKAPVTRLEYLRAHPAEFEAVLMTIGLPTTMMEASDQEIRRAVVESMLKAAEGRTLGLNGKSVREYAHEDDICE